MFEKASSMIEDLGIEPIQIPYQRQGKRLLRSSLGFFKVEREFFKVLDCLDVQFRERFNQPDLEKIIFSSQGI